MLLGYKYYFVLVNANVNKGDLSFLPKDSVLKIAILKVLFWLRKKDWNIWVFGDAEVQSLISKIDSIKADNIRAIWPSTAHGRLRIFALSDERFYKIEGHKSVGKLDLSFIFNLFNDENIHLFPHSYQKWKNLDVYMCKRMPYGARPIRNADEGKAIFDRLLGVSRSRHSSSELQNLDWYGDMELDPNVELLVAPTHGDIGGSNIWLKDNHYFIIDFENSCEYGLYGYDILCWFLKFEDYYQVNELKMSLEEIGFKHQWNLVIEKLKLDNNFLYQRISEKYLTYNTNVV